MHLTVTFTILDGSLLLKKVLANNRKRNECLVDNKNKSHLRVNYIGTLYDTCHNDN